MRKRELRARITKNVREQYPRTRVERRIAAGNGRLEIQLDFERRPIISQADDLILVADDLLNQMDVPWAHVTDSGALTIHGHNRSVVYHLVDHDDQDGVWVGVRRGGHADR